MRRIRGLLMFCAATACAAALVPSARAGNDKKRDEALALIEKARELSDIRAEGSPPFRLEAKTSALDADGKWVQGTYLLVWAAPERWRQEITEPGFTEVEVAAPGKIWKKRNVPYRPLDAFGWEAATKVTSFFELPPGTKIDGIKVKHLDGTEMNCVRTSAARYAPRGGWIVNRSEICFAVGSGVLRRENFAESGSYYAWNDYAPLGQKMFPHLRRGMAGPKLETEFTVQRLSLESHLDPSLFAPPTGAQEWPSCAQPKAPIPVGGDPLFYPNRRPAPTTRLLAERRHGEVLTYYEIGVEGDVRNIYLGSRATEEVKSYVDSVLSHTHYTPAMCGNTPVPWEMGGEITFP